MFGVLDTLCMLSHGIFTETLHKIFIETEMRE